MATPITSQPKYTDGIAAVSDSLVACINFSPAQNYLYADDAISEAAVHSQHADPAGQALGSITQASGFFSGSVNLQLINVDDPIPRPGYICAFREKYYKVAGSVGAKRTKNKVVTMSVPLEEVINPVLTALLSSAGQVKSASVVGASGTFDAGAVKNTRAGATLAYDLSAWTEEYPLATVPSGLTISDTTGVLTCASVATGTYYLKVTVTDSVTDQPTKVGVGFLILTTTSE
jgi:hypothetical protein